MDKNKIKLIITISMLLACVLILWLTFFVPKEQIVLCTTITVSFFTLLFFIADQFSTIQNLQKQISDKLNEPERTLILFFENATYWNCKASEKNKNILETVLQKSGRQYKNNSHGWFSVEKLDGETEGEFKNVLDKYAPPKKEFEFFTY